VPPGNSQGRIAVETPCVSCGYDLRTLSSEALCPECGVAVSRTIDRRLLRFCDPSWRLRLYIGVLILLVWTALWIPALGLSLLHGTLGDFDTRTHFVAWFLRFHASTEDERAFVLWPKVMFGGLVAGAWLITTREPGQGRDLRLRLSCRLGVGAAAVACVVAGIMAHDFLASYCHFWPVGVSVLAICLGLICVYLGRLGERVPRRYERRLSHALLLCLGLTWGFSTMGAMCPDIAGTRGPSDGVRRTSPGPTLPTPRSSAHCYRTVVGSGALVCAVLGLALLIGCAQSIGTSLQGARQIQRNGRVLSAGVRNSGQRGRDAVG